MKKKKKIEKKKGQTRGEKIGQSVVSSRNSIPNRFKYGVP
jgi:hypothetical protein